MRRSLVVSVVALGILVLVGRVGGGSSAPVGPGVAASVGLPASSGPVPVPVSDLGVSEAEPGPVTVRTHDGGSFEVDAGIAADVQRLLDDAAADGVVLGGWGLRSHQRQHELRKINGCPDDGSWTHSEGEDPSSWVSASSCRVPTARPGFSNHESGKAIDFTYGGSVIGSRQSPAFQWLAANAGRYGLKNLPSEPWHWSVNGK